MTIPAIDPISVGLRTDPNSTPPTSRASEPFDVLLRPVTPVMPAASTTPPATSERGKPTGEAQMSASTPNANSSSKPANTAPASDAPVASADQATSVESNEKNGERAKENAALPPAKAEHGEESQDEESGNTATDDDAAIDAIVVSASTVPLAEQAQGDGEAPKTETVLPLEGVEKETKSKAVPERHPSLEKQTTAKNASAETEDSSAISPIADEKLGEPETAVLPDELLAEPPVEDELVSPANEESQAGEEEVRIAKHLRSTRNKDTRQSQDDASQARADEVPMADQPIDTAAVEMVASAPAREINRKSTERNSPDSLKAAAVSAMEKNAVAPPEAPPDAAKSSTEVLKNTPTTSDLPTAVQVAETGPKSADDKSAAGAATRANTAANALFGHSSSQRPHAAGKTEAPSEAVQTRVVQRVARAFEIARSRGDDTLRIRLSPPELGALKLEIRVEAGVMTAKIEAENSLARDVLVDNLGALRQRLAEQNIRVEQFDIGLADRRAGQDFSQGDRQDLPNDRQERNTIGKNDDSSSVDRNGKDAARVTIAKGEPDTRLDVII